MRTHVARILSKQQLRDRVRAEVPAYQIGYLQSRDGTWTDPP